MGLTKFLLPAVLVACVPVDGELPGGTSGGETTGASTTEVLPTTGEVLDIGERLAAIDGLVVEEWPSEISGYRYFVMNFEQPADHDQPDGPRFTQRATLLHRDEAAPTVMITAGYFIYPEYQDLGEPALLLAGNQLSVEHRFFTPSRPDPADWSTLTIQQAAADHHRISAALRSAIYTGPWVATGGSKSGMASVYFRRFYPDDVDVTIAYVAPQSYGDKDPRYLEFVAQRGDASCRQALYDLRREVLLRRPAMLAAMAEQAEAEELTYTILNMDQALESAVIEFVFTFWQYQTAELCPQIPLQDASDEDVWLFLDLVVSPKYWSDDWYLGYEPYFWQAATQLGYPAYDELNVEDLLIYPGIDVARSYVQIGEGKDPTLDLAAMQDIAAWLPAEGQQMLFVYGENDPYSAAMFDPGGAAEVLRFVAPDGNHGSGILDLADADRGAALAALAAWTGVTPTVPRDRARRSARAALRGHAW